MGCCVGKKYVGNLIFKPIEIKLSKCGDIKLDKMFQDMEKYVKDAEVLRQKIAAKFREMIVATGSCVLLHPTVERSITSFLISILVEINKDLDNDWTKIQQFEFRKLLLIDSKPPFVHLNEEKKNELKSNFKVDIEDNPDIVNGRTAILAFIESLNLFKDFFAELGTKSKTVYKDMELFIQEIKKGYNSVGKDHITMGQALDYIKTAESNMQHSLEVTEVLTMMGNLFFEIASTIYALSQNIMHPNQIIKWQKIAADAVKKKILNPKEIVFVYAKEAKCKRIQEWEANICYREEEEELKF